MSNLQSELKTWVFDDIILDSKKCTGDDISRSADITGKHFLLRSHAILCGLTMYHFTLLTCETGWRMMNNSYHVPRMAHLWNSMRLDRAEELHWPDMQAFVDMVGEDAAFAGKRPESAGESLERLRALEQLEGPNKYQYKSSPTKKLAAEWTWAVPTVFMATALKRRYVLNKNFGLSIQDVDSILRQIATDHLHDGTKLAPPSTIEKLHERWTATRRMSIIQFLAVVKQAMHYEEPLLQFNHFGLDQRCTELFRLIRQYELDNFQRLFASIPIPDGADIATITSFIFMVDKARKDWLQNRSDSSGAIGDLAGRILTGCREVMRNFLRKNGVKGCRELRAFCKNKSVDDVQRRLARAEESAYWLSLDGNVDRAVLAVFPGYHTDRQSPRSGMNG